MDFLQSLLDSVASHCTTLRFPGIARFLRDPAGQSLLRQVESRFQCIIQLDGKPWSPPDPQVRPHGEGSGKQVPLCWSLLCRSSVGDAAPRSPQLELEELLPPSSHFDSWHQDVPEGSNAAADNGDGGDNGFHSNVGEGRGGHFGAHSPGAAVG